MTCDHRRKRDRAFNKLCFFINFTLLILFFHYTNRELSQQITGGPVSRAGVSPIFRGRFFVRRFGKRYRSRRGGRGAGWSGDACVALGGRASRVHAGMQGDASVPTQPHTAPAPTRPEKFVRLFTSF